MNFIASTQAEMLKTKRTASFWVSTIGAAFIPALFFIVLMTEDDAHINLAETPWIKYFNLEWQILSMFVLSFYVILVFTLVTQIETRNNTWKQVHATPQSVATIYFSKFLAIQVMIFSCFVMFNILSIVSPLLANWIRPEYTFLERAIDWNMLLKMNAKSYLSIMGVTAIQYWLSIRFKNFVIPVGVGLGLLIAGVVALNFNWEHIYKFPYAYPILSYDYLNKPGRPVIENHEWNSIGYFLFFLALGYVELLMRKEKG